MPFANEIHIFSDERTKTFFYTPWHGYRGPNPAPLPSSWVCVTYTLPMQVAPRPGFEDGMLKTRFDIVRLFHPDYTEINPI